jgi:hypothetical protein
MGIADLLLFLAVAPALAVALLRAAHAVGAVDPAAWPPGALSAEAFAAAAVLALVAVGLAGVRALRRIARDLREILVRSRARELTSTAPGADVVDFAIHLERLRRADPACAAAPAAELGEKRPRERTTASHTLSEIKSRLAHIPSVRAGAASEGS